MEVCDTSEGEQLPFPSCAQPATTASMASSAEWSCPICHEASDSIAYVGNCLHEFCRGCILRWVRNNPSCPLCRQTVHSIIYPAPLDRDFLEMATEHPLLPRSPDPWEEPDAAEQSRPLVTGLSPETWAFCFRNYSEILRPVEMWMSKVLHGPCWWDVAFTKGRVVASLCRYGLREDALMRDLEPLLAEQTASFVRQLIDVASHHCSEQARRRALTAHQRAAPEAGADPGPSQAQQQRPQGSERAGASGAAPSGGCGPDASGRRRGGGSQDTGAAPQPQNQQNN